jgi:hypothetical protein
MPGYGNSIPAGWIDPLAHQPLICLQSKVRNNWLTLLNRQDNAAGSK